MNYQEIIAEIASNVLNIKTEKLDFSVELETIETWDSFSHLTLLSAVENETGVVIPLEEYAKINTLGKLLKKINEG